MIYIYGGITAAVIALPLALAFGVIRRRTDCWPLQGRFCRHFSLHFSLA
ncbi:hypothetical protein ACFL2N_00345 [Pseudomonadota bacterium]